MSIDGDGYLAPLSSSSKESGHKSFSLDPSSSLDDEIIIEDVPRQEIAIENFTAEKIESGSGQVLSLTPDIKTAELVSTPLQDPISFTPEEV